MSQQSRSRLSPEGIRRNTGEPHTEQKRAFAVSTQPVYKTTLRLTCKIQLLPRGGAVWQLVGLITRRSKVQILPPQPDKTRASAAKPAAQNESAEKASPRARFLFVGRILAASTHCFLCDRKDEDDRRCACSRFIFDRNWLRAPLQRVGARAPTRRRRKTELIGPHGTPATKQRRAEAPPFDIPFNVDALSPEQKQHAIALRGSPTQFDPRLRVTIERSTQRSRGLRHFLGACVSPCARRVSRRTHRGRTRCTAARWCCAGTSGCKSVRCVVAAIEVRQGEDTKAEKYWRSLQRSLDSAEDESSRPPRHSRERH